MKMSNFERKYSSGYRHMISLGKTNRRAMGSWWLVRPSSLRKRIYSGPQIWFISSIFQQLSIRIAKSLKHDEVRKLSFSNVFVKDVGFFAHFANEILPAWFYMTRFSMVFRIICRTRHACTCLKKTFFFFQGKVSNSFKSH